VTHEAATKFLDYGALGLLALVLMGAGIGLYRLLGKLFERVAAAFDKIAATLEATEKAAEARHRELCEAVALAGRKTRKTVRELMNGGRKPSSDEDDDGDEEEDHGH
jgi:hypothetical protein